LQSLAFTVRRRALALVRARLSFVRHLLAIVCDLLPLVGDPISLRGEPLAFVELGLAAHDGLLARGERGGPALKLGRRVGTVVSDHDSP
jgi:hypothetical protein